VKILHLYTLIFVSFILIGQISYSQQIPQFTQWSSHQMALNPAHAGIKSCIDIHSLYRIQWVGFQGAPKSGFFTLSAPIKTRRKNYLSARHGLGLKFETDQIGHFNTNRINMAYAAHFNFTRDTRLSLGLYGGIIQMGFDPSNSVTIEPDPTVNKEASFIAPDASFGAWWNGENYYVGLVLQNLFRYKWTDLGTDSRYRFHSIINAGYRFNVNDRITLMPAFILKIPPRGPLAIDLNAIVDFSNKFNLGLGYRNIDALLFFAGFKINQRFSMQYSFDFTLSELQNGSNNTHELSISFSACKPQNNNTSRCPLFE
jgi:type IX secretion system PorP/SprF family membrane protein